MTLLHFIVASFTIALSAHAEEDVDRVVPTPTVKIEVGTEQNANELSKNYRFMISDFVKAGGRGRTFFVRSNVSEVAGPYFAVDRWPPSASTKGASIFTRDVGVLNSLKAMQKSGVPIFLQSTDQGPDAQVFADDELGRPLRQAAFPKSKTSHSMSIAPSMTADILLHEQSHISHRAPNSEYLKFLDSIQPQVSGKAYRAIRRGLTEVLAYQAQYGYLEQQKHLGNSTILVLDKKAVGHAVKRADFDIYRKNQLREMQAAIGMYTQSIASQFRTMPDEARCKTIDHIRDALVGMGSIEKDFVENEFHFDRCEGSSSTVFLKATSTKGEPS